MWKIVILCFSILLFGLTMGTRFNGKVVFLLPDNMNFILIFKNYGIEIEVTDSNADPLKRGVYGYWEEKFPKFKLEAFPKMKLSRPPNSAYFLKFRLPFIPMLLFLTVILWSFIQLNKWKRI